jgi:hypothetical protein
MEVCHTLPPGLQCPWKLLAELRRLTVQINLRRRSEIRRAAQQRRPQTHTAVEPPRWTSRERRRTKSPEGALEDDDIVEYVQGTNESTQSWLTESARRAVTHGRKHKSSDRDVTTPATNPRDPDLDVITLKIVQSPTPQQRVLDYRQKMESYWSDTEPLMREYDNNDNEVVHPPTAPNQPGKGHRQIGPRNVGEYKYREEGPSRSDTREPYLASDNSYESDDNGHRDCGRGGYHACPDNPANYNMQDGEDDDITVVDVFNTNQELHRGEDSEAEPSSGGDRDSFGEDGFGLKVIEETK